MVEGLFKWQDDTKNHFKAKIKLLLELLIRKCGLDAVKAVMPEEHMKLLTNIRKIKDRKERKAKSSDDGELFTARTSISRARLWTCLERRNSRRPAVAVGIPHTSLIEVVGVPGSFEIPVVAQQLGKSGDHLED
ncbi:ribosomal RNA-processing protein 12-like isoform X4 [Ananas comosus]|uniref:Ribosomal RNA-processing protein 12-like isoform X4 n=1 Tax=Ananas comosus TaxID=4615 RepID=A0A6P5ES35_ANACO|nr:ribosomal RNA-processing protein 12-like isoform X4 [Ananas comosus]